MSKDGRGSDRWFPYALQSWHFHWEARADHVLMFDVVADPEPSHKFRSGGVSMERGSCLRRCTWVIRETFLFLLRRHRGVLGEFLTWIVLTTCRTGVGSRGELVWGHDGASVSGGGWTRQWTRLTGAVDVEVDDEGTEGDGEGMLRRPSTVIMVTTMTTINTGPWGGVAAGHVAVGGVSPHDGGYGGEWYGLGMGDRADSGDGGLGSGPLGDYFVGVPAHDQTLQESTPWVSPGSMFSGFLALDGLDVDFGGSNFLDEITAIMQEDVVARRRGQSSGT
ncbi:uncharacterized protein LOC130935343 [Arachis stenosperma]|uniref:uncharacterized protein LOC130935343 n=1 Tax=Arachis stenosperma TaxID=217475 RepID=UPI0025ABD7B1|nr:uncharacterized protein LOC130935343 [Arachis stenosperma]